MKVIETHSEPSTVKDRKPYRVRIEGRNGDAIEIMEQMNGGFAITAASTLTAELLIVPITRSLIIVRTK